MQNVDYEAIGRVIYSIQRAQGLLDNILRTLEERGAATTARACMPALLTLTGELQLLNEQRETLASRAADAAMLVQMAAHAAQIGEGLGSLYQEILDESHVDPL